MAVSHATPRASASRDRQMLDHQPVQRPGHLAPGQPRPRVRGPARVLAPHTPTGRAPVAAHPDQQRRGPPPERRVRRPTRDAVTHHPLGAAPPAEHGRPRRARRPHQTRHGTPATPSGSSHPGPRPPTPARPDRERRHVRRAEGSVVHVEVFRDERVGAFILGRPRRLSRGRRAHPLYTLIREEQRMSPQSLGFHTFLKVVDDLPRRRYDRSSPSSSKAFGTSWFFSRASLRRFMRSSS